MAKATEFTYVSTKKLGNVGDKVLELGHYIVDGKENADKIYLVSNFTRRNGETGSKATAVCSLDEAKDIANIIINNL